MLEQNKFVVTHKKGIFSSKDGFEIADADSGEVIATAGEKSKGFMANILGMMLGKDKMSVTIEVRRKSDDGLEFAVRRSGFISQKVQVLDSEEQVVGSFKAKVFSLSGGFTVYDKDGNQFADLQGKMFSAEYKFMNPKGTMQMGSVSRTWGGLAKSMFSGAGTYGVDIAPEFAKNQPAKMLLLGAAIAIDTVFKKADSKKGGGTVGVRGSGGSGEE